MGKKIVFEGLDSCGKETQYNLLRGRLISEGYDVAASISFPQYDEESSYFVRQYLDGYYGNDASSVPPKVASMFFALDRYDFYHNVKNQAIIEHLNNPNTIAVFNRDVTSNLVFQTAKGNSEEEMIEIIDFICDLEYGKFEIARPDMVVMPHMSLEQNIELLKKRDVAANAIRNNMKNDIHEKDLVFLTRVHTASELIAKRLNFDIVNCMDSNGKLRTIEDIHEEIYDRVKRKVLCRVQKRF